MPLRYRKGRRDRPLPASPEGSSSKAFAGFSQLKKQSASLSAPNNGGANRILDERARRLLPWVHKICGTRLWMACTRLILQQIKERIFC
jgi:hypothetical protein